MDYGLQSYTAGDAIAAGFLVFGICAFFGLRLLIRGIRDDVLDSSGMPIANRIWFIVGGIVLIIPLAAFSLFVWRQGHLGHVA
jgi:hypothetical protein